MLPLRSIFLAPLLMVIVVTLATSASAAPVLSGIILYSTDSSGNRFENIFWDTNGNGSEESSFKLYVIRGGLNGSFINSGNGPKTHIKAPLANGVHTFTLYGESGPPDEIGYWGLNLFFDGNNTVPGISVFGPTKTSTLDPPFFVTQGNSRALDGRIFTLGTGSFSFVDGGTTVTLTSYFWAARTVFTTDRVGAFDNEPSGGDDGVAQFTLTVNTASQPIPEPATIVLLSMGLAGIGGIIRKR